MDSRTALSPSTELRFGPDTCCTIRAEAGRGGSCIVYDAVYRTNAGDEKSVRIRECYPYDLMLKREKSGVLTCPPEAAGKFDASKEQMFRDFRCCNALFYAEPASDAIINMLNIYEANNTVYTVSAWSRENALPNLKITSLRDCLSIVRQTAAAVQCIHQAGYLYPDIKPDNISVINSLTKRVQLFDFDSLIPINTLPESDAAGRCRISYTRGFAALELRRGQLSRLGPHTDVYGIGALLFYLLFGSTPEAPDCISGASFDFSAMKWRSELPDRFFIQLQEFFRKTLAGFIPDRYADMNSAVEKLQELERLADPARPYLVSSVINKPAFCIGRDAETEELADWYQDETRKALFISGMGGIGKSTFVRAFLAERRNEWDSILILYFSGTVRQTVINDDMLRINGMQRFPEEKEADYFERKMRTLNGIVRRDRVLIVVDNFDNEHDPDLFRLLELDCKTILITRHTLGSLNLPVLKLDAIRDMDTLEQLFVHYLGRDILETESEIVRAIIRDLSGHTLAAELFARQIANSFLSLNEAQELLEKQGILRISTDRVDYQRDGLISYDRMGAIITRLFETDSLSPLQISILKAAALFPAPGIPPRELMRLSGTEQAEPLALLIRCGWITQDNANIFLHPLIRDVVSSLPKTAENRAGIDHVLQTLCDEIAGESKKEEQLASAAAGSFSENDLTAIVTDHLKLFHYVAAARGVLDILSEDPEIKGCPRYQKLFYRMVTNLPKQADSMILHYGQKLLDDPVHLLPYEIMDTADIVEGVLLEHQEFGSAFQLADAMKKYAVDDRSKADHCMLYCGIYDTRDEIGDREKLLEYMNIGIIFARRAPHPERKHLLAQYLLSKMNFIARRGYEDGSEFEALRTEVLRLIETECLPYSEIRHGFAVAMGFFHANVSRDHEQADRCIAEALAAAEKLYPLALDFIDFMIIPAAIIYIDLQDYESSRAALTEGIRICSEYKDLTAYLRKSHDLRRYLLDVYAESGNEQMLRETVEILDEECSRYGLPDTVPEEIRAYLNNQQPGSCG